MAAIAGGSAVCLLTEGISGVTVTGFHRGKIDYMPVAKAIKQRYVDLDEINLFEQLGFCFGRVRQEFEPGHKEVKGYVQRIY